MTTLRKGQLIKKTKDDYKIEIFFDAFDFIQKKPFFLSRTKELSEKKYFLYYKISGPCRDKYTRPIVAQTILDGTTNKKKP